MLTRWPGMRLAPTHLRRQLGERGCEVLVRPRRLHLDEVQLAVGVEAFAVSAPVHLLARLA